MSLCVYPTLEAYADRERRERREHTRHERKIEQERAAVKRDYWDWHGPAEDELQAIHANDPPAKPSIDPVFPPVHESVLEALAWGVLGAVMGRWGTALDLHITNADLGSDANLCLIRESCDRPGVSERLLFDTSGDGRVTFQRGDEKVALPPLTNLLCSGRSIESVVQAVERCTGWVSQSDTPVTPAVLLAGLVARALQRAALTPEPLRVSPGWDGGLPAEWLDQLPEGLAVWLLDDEERRARSQQFWLLCAREPQDEFEDGWSLPGGAAVVLDMMTGECVSLHSLSRVNLLESYRQNGDSWKAALRKLDQLLDVS